MTVTTTWFKTIPASAVEQDGVACHTGRRSCFYRAWREGRLETIQEVETDPAILYGGHSHSHG